MPHGLPLVLHRPVGVAELGREVRLHQRQVAPHVEDLVEDLDVDRADLVARLARRARPDLLGGDALEQRVGGDGDLGRRRRSAGDTGRRAGGGHDLADLQHDLAGSSGLPVACAGHTLVQRPHIVQASVSSSCFQVKSSTVGGAEASRARSPSGWASASSRPWAARGRCRYMFSGDVNMCRSIVIGRITRKTKKRDDVRRPT